MPRACRGYGERGNNHATGQKLHGGNEARPHPHTLLLTRLADTLAWPTTWETNKTSGRSRRRASFSLRTRKEREATLTWRAQRGHDPLVTHRKGRNLEGHDRREDGARTMARAEKKKATLKKKTQAHPKAVATS